VIAHAGDRASVIAAQSGKVLYELEADNGYSVRALPVVLSAADKATTLVVAVEPGGVLVARDAEAGGRAVWARRVAGGYVRELHPAGDGVAVELSGGELVLVAAADGKPVVVEGGASTWRVPGGSDLLFDDAHRVTVTGELHGYGLDGASRFRAAYATPGPLDLAILRGAGEAAFIALVSHRGEAKVLLAEPQSGAISSVHVLSPRWVHGSVWSAIVDGRPVAGAVLHKPFGVQFF
jgi:hypothetical protein